VTLQIDFPLKALLTTENDAAEGLVIYVLALVSDAAKSFR
jgi:hypothetical protein